MTVLAGLVSLAMTGYSGASSVGPPAPTPIRVRADGLEPRAHPRTWRGVDLELLEARLKPGAVIAVPRDARAVAWSRGATSLVATDVEGTIRVVSAARRSDVADPHWTVEVRLRSRGQPWRLEGRQPLRIADPTAAPGTLLPAEVRRLLVVVPDGWRTPQARARRWERAGPGAPWQAAGPELRALVGRDGAWWVRGLQGDHPPGPTRDDSARRAGPAGVFRARSVGGAIHLSGPDRTGDVASLVARQGPGTGGDFSVAVAPEDFQALVPWVKQEERLLPDRPGIELVTIAAVAVLPREVYRDVAGVWGLPPLD